MGNQECERLNFRMFVESVIHPSDTKKCLRSLPRCKINGIKLADYAIDESLDDVPFKPRVAVITHLTLNCTNIHDVV